MKHAIEITETTWGINTLIGMQERIEELLYEKQTKAVREELRQLTTRYNASVKFDAYHTNW